MALFQYFSSSTITPTPIAKFIGPTWGPSGFCGSHVGPINLALWAIIKIRRSQDCIIVIMTKTGKTASWYSNVPLVHSSNFIWLFLLRKSLWSGTLESTMSVVCPAETKIPDAQLQWYCHVILLPDWGLKSFWLFFSGNLWIIHLYEFPCVCCVALIQK